MCGETVWGAVWGSTWESCLEELWGAGCRGAVFIHVLCLSSSKTLLGFVYQSLFDSVLIVDHMEFST